MANVDISLSWRTVNVYIVCWFLQDEIDGVRIGRYPK